MVSIAMHTISTDEQDEEALAVQALADPQAFAELYRRNFQPVYRYHLARTGSTPTAQDLTTQTFLAALDGLAGFRHSGSFKAWLFGIARNLQALHWRSQRKELPLEAAESLPDPAPLPEVVSNQHQLVAQAAQALEYLNPQRREALLLCLFGDLEAEEAARVMGKSPAAVKMLLMRGLQDLRGFFGTAAEVE